MLLVDTKEKIFKRDDILKSEIANMRPIQRWLDEEVGLCVRACVRAYVRVHVVSRVQNVADSWGPGSGLEEISVIIMMRLFMESLSLLVVYIRQ